VQYKLLSHGEFESRNGVKASMGKRYFAHSSLADIIAHYPMRQGLRVRLGVLMCACINLEGGGVLAFECAMLEEFIVLKCGTKL
jgi:hypothetical protein